MIQEVLLVCSCHTLNKPSLQRGLTCALTCIIQKPTILREIELAFCVLQEVLLVLVVHVTLVGALVLLLWEQDGEQQERVVQVVGVDLLRCGVLVCPQTVA